MKAASTAEGGPRRAASGRRVYRQSQGASAFPNAPGKQIASFVAPAGVFVAVTFGMEILLVTDF